MKPHINPAEWVNLKLLHPQIKLDIAYARADNFIGEKVYPLAEAFLMKPVANDLLGAQLDFLKLGYGILVFDAYRPWSVTKLFWDRSTPEVQKYLADPEMGSAHNRGAAIDCSLWNLSTGKEVQMPSRFDEMNERAHLAYAGGTMEARQLRDLFQTVMVKNNFRSIPNEWWHLNHISHKDYPVMNFSFEEILQAL